LIITSHALSTLFLGTLVGLTMNTRTVEGITMDDKVRKKVAEAAAKENGWKLDEVAIDEKEELRRPTCSFYVARNKVHPLSYVDNFALLDGDKLMGIGDGKVVAKILDECSSGASADWWAEIVTRFHSDLGGGVVLHNERTRSDVTRELMKAGKNFFAPVLDQAQQSVRFLLLDPESGAIYRVEAKRDASGAIGIAQTEVLQ
jgi:hypothetical protein